MLVRPLCFHSREWFLLQKLESWVNIDGFVVVHSLKAEHCGLAEPLAKAGGFERDREWPFSLPMAKWPLFNTAARN